MGKTKRARKKANVTSPIAVSNTSQTSVKSEVGSSEESHTCAKETEIMTVIEQLQSPRVEDKILGLHSLATIFEDPDAVGEVLQHKIVKLAGPLLVERSSFVRNAAAGALRNLSACGSHEICDLLVEQDVMTPLSALIQQYAAEWIPTPRKNDSGKVDEQVDTLVQSIHLLWNICESSSSALKYFNKSNLLPILVKCLDYAVFGMEASIASAHCLNTISEDNPSAVSQLKDLEGQIVTLVNIEGEGFAALLLRTLSCGLLLNLNGGKVDGIAPTNITQIMKTLSDALDGDQKKALNAVTSNMPDEKDEPTVIQQKMEALLQVRYLVEAQQTALEILANLCSDDNEDDDAMEEDLSSDGEEIFNEPGLIESEQQSVTEKFPLNITSDVHEGIVGHQLVRKVWEKTSFPPDNVCLILSEHETGKQLHNKVATLRCRAFLCLNNLLSGLDIEDVGGAENLYKMWVDIGVLIFKHTKAEDIQLLEAATSAMRAALQRLAAIKTNMFGQLSEADITLMFNGVQQCVDENVRVNLIRSVGTLGLIISTSSEENSQMLLRNIGKFVMDICSKETVLWVIAEALDVVMDVFAEDETDLAAAEINLVEKLNAILPSLKHKVRLQRKSLGEHFQIVTTVNMNLSRFIKYKSNRIALLRQKNGHSNGNSSSKVQ